MKMILGILFALFTQTAFAQLGDWSFNYGASAGNNSVQGFHYTIFAQIGTPIEENLSGGLSGYFSAGEKPSHDREFGVGPFLSYGIPIFEFLSIGVREEINYVNLYDPFLISTNPNVWDHEEETGFASSTSAGIGIHLGPLVLSAGYRLVIALTNSALDDGRSGPYFGLGIAF